MQIAAQVLYAIRYFFVGLKIENIEVVSQFRSMVGSLVYITITRPDIAYVVRVVSQFMQKPRTIHLDAAYRILRYLKGSPGKGLLFPSSSSLQFQLLLLKLREFIL